VGDTTKLLVIAASPVATFNAGGTICQRDSVLLTSTASLPGGTITSWYWNFGDGNTATLTNGNPFYHRYNTPGTYTIYLIATGSNGCKSDTAFSTVNVLPRPQALFSYDRNICTGDSIRFTDNSSFVPGNSITSWQWNFGDGNSSTFNNNNPFYHTYTTAGNFTVSLIVNGSNSCLSDTFRLTVNVTAKPTASITVTGKPCMDSLQTFTSSIATGGNPANWFWDFGDAQTFNSSSSNIATHAYTTVLTNITVKHAVSFSGGCGTDTATISIPLINPNPTANFTITGDTLCEKKPLFFSSTSTGVSNWNWNFGNGTGSNIPPFSKSYTTAGTYTISLVTQTAAGCGSLPATQTITINPLPNINAGPDKFFNLGGAATLDATISNPSNYDFLWTPSTYLNSPVLLNPVSAPDIPVTYTIQASDKNSNCIASDEVVITPVSDIFIPSAFTPNNDGRNDKWVIPGLALYPDALVTVFNRAGQKLFASTGYINNPWNGTYKGIVQPNEVYVYLVQLNDDKKRILKGTVTIIR